MRWGSRRMGSRRTASARCRREARPAPVVLARLLLVLVAVSSASAFIACRSEHRLEIENRSSQTLFVCGTRGGMNETTAWKFIEPGTNANPDLGDEKNPDAVHFYFDHPRNSDGTPGRFPPD